MTSVDHAGLQVELDGGDRLGYSNLLLARVVPGMHVNQWDEGIAPVQDLIRETVPVDRHRLADPAVPLRDSVECNGIRGPGWLFGGG